MELFNKVVGVEQSFADALNADKKTSAISFLRFALAQCCIPNSSLRLGSRPGTSRRKISRESGGGGVGKKSAEFIGVHGFCPSR